MSHADSTQIHRRTLLKAGACGAVWLTSLAEILARRAEADLRDSRAHSLIVLWLAGGPSQLETFDPHAGSRIAGDTKAIDTSAPGVQLASGLPLLAERMKSIALVRSLVSKEGDHERGTYLLKTGYRPDPTAVHPSMGAIACHELPMGGTEIPRHISILPGRWPARGGFLGEQFDAFKIGDPRAPIEDVAPNVSDPRLEARLADLAFMERSFARRRAAAAATQHEATVESARRMMTSEQLRAFDIAQESKSAVARYGDSPFGRGCLAARRLIEVGVRCVEVTLDGWDSHVNNHEIHQRQNGVLDPALAALIDDLQEHESWERTLVLVAGEFGRTPDINRLGGRDHWPHGFSAVLAGGPIRGGIAIGETDPAGGRTVHQPRPVADLHATVLAALAIEPLRELISPVGRPLKLSEGRPIDELLR